MILLGVIASGFCIILLVSAVILEINDPPFPCPLCGAKSAKEHKTECAAHHTNWRP